MGEIGDLVSAFVEERVDGPARGEEDSWQEAVFAGLFSCAFEATMRLSEARQDPESLQQVISKTIDEVVASASVWVNRRLSRKPRWWFGPRINVDISDRTRERLTACFNEAITALSNSGWTLEAARSHACFGVLSRARLVLTTRGVFKNDEGARQFIELAMAGCDSMGNEVAAALDSRKS